MKTILLNPSRMNFVNIFSLKINFILILISIFVSISIHAQPMDWNQTGPGGGGALYYPSISPYDNTMFVACDMSDLFRLTNLGANWKVVHHRQIQTSGDSHVQFTGNPLILYCLDLTYDQGTDAVRPSKSTDGGITWNRLSNDPTNSQATYLFTDITSTNKVILSDYLNMYYSTDGGTTFSMKYQTIDASLGLHIAGVFFDGQNIFIGTNEGLLVSTNGGTSFSVSSVGGIPANQAIVSFAGAKQNNITRFFCITHNGVYAGIKGGDYAGYQGIYSLDWGQSNWTLKTNGIAAGRYPFFISMAQNNINVAYVAGGSNVSAPIVYKTTNAGALWQSVFLTTNNQNIITGWSGAGGDRDWSYGEYALGFSVAPLDVNKACITDLGFAHITTNGGTSWNQSYVHPNDQNPMNAQTPKGKTYHTVGLENTSCWWMTWADANNLFASFTDIRGYRSTDGGYGWSFNYSGHTLNTMYQCLKHPVTGNLYAATSSIHDLYQSTYLADNRIDGGTGKIIFSTDKGAAWQTLHDFGHPVIFLAIDPNNTNRMYASVVHSIQGGIYISNNIQNGAGSTWTKCADPPRTQGHPFNIFVLKDGSVVTTFSARRAGSPLAFTNSSGVFVSTNNGTSWIDRSDYGMKYWTKDITIDPHDTTQNTWYVGVWGGWSGPSSGLGGLYKTNDRGLNWIRLVDQDRISSCTISPTFANRLYFTSETEGLWVTNNLNSPTPIFSEVDNFPFRHPERVFYNPYDTRFIWVTSFGNGIYYGDDEFVPVELVSFNAYRADDGVMLKWSTASETNNAGFEIERSRIQSAEGGSESSSPKVNQNGNWEKIGFVNGNGTSTIVHEYSFFDRNVSTSEKYFYRLKQIDLNGTFEFSKEIEVDFAPASSFYLGQNFPNPFTQSTIIQIDLTPTLSLNKERETVGQRPVTLKVFDIFGREVLDLSDVIINNWELRTGNFELTIDNSQLKNPGVYFYRLTTPTFTQTKAMVMIK